MILLAAPAWASALPEVPVVVDQYALVERAPVRGGFAPFAVEAFALLPAPVRRESFVAPEAAELSHPLRRTVDRVLRRKEIARGWSRSNEASLKFGDELAQFPGADGVSYSIEGEMVLHGAALVPLGLRLSVPPGLSLRYAVGLIVADQVVLEKDGVLDATRSTVDWTLRLHPNGPDAAVPVRAVFAVRADGGGSLDERRRALAGASAALIVSSDGRAAVAERAREASEWLKPLPVFLKPEQVAPAAADPKAKPDKAAKDKKPENGGGHH